MIRSSHACKSHYTLLLATILFFSLGLRAQNPIVTENSLPGNPKSEWDISGAGDPNIQGFATDMSVNKGQTVRFKIDVNGGGTYSIRIYRLGYYQGNGARLVANLGNFNAVNQPEPVSNTSTGWVDCGNWSESASWNVPANAVSGVYIARLTRSTGSSHIIFVVRDDAGNAPILFKTSDATWQAYNGYGGNSLYVGVTSYPAGHAVKVSYNRPFVTRAGGAGGGAGEDWIFNAEYPMIRFLERNGYHVSYTTDVDMERSTTPITPALHKIFLSVGHDEYWSAAARTRIENARAAGVHLAFFSGNEVYWKTRWEDNTRTLVCYKEGTLGEINCGGKCDPSPEWTGLWRDGCAFAGAGACQPENALTGQISWTLSTGSITVPGAYRNHRFWRNTSVAALGANQTATLPNGTLGYEWDYEQYPASYPSGRIILSSTTLNGFTHKLSLYRHSSGALVFGAGTVQWAWGLDNVHDRGSAAPSTAMQQATVNLLADMGVQPGALMSGLSPASASTDFSAPSPVISSPLHNSTVPANTSLSISGTCTDAGGVVAGVEVSVDGGNSWALATGTSNWTFSWIPSVSGSANIRVRAFDDSGNMSVPGNAGTASHISITVSGGSTTGTYSIFAPTASPQIPFENDGSAITLGVKFRSSQAGFITGIRYYKPNGATGTRTGILWSATGTKLAEVQFTNETSSGWQQAMFSAPVPIVANSTYVAAYFSSSGDYCSSNPYFTTAVVNGPLHALANGEDGGNGLYRYGSPAALPTSTYGSSNYFVDVVFSNATDTEPPLVNTVSPASGSSNASLTTTVSASFSEDMDPASIQNSSFSLRDAQNTLLQGTVSYQSSTRTAILSLTSPLAYSSTYTATITGGSAGVKDMAGNALQSNFTWTFTTVADQQAPQIQTVSPASGATAVLVNQVISGTFNEAMLASSINTSTVQVSLSGGGAIPGTVLYDAGTRSFSFTASSLLQTQSTYTVTVLGGTGGVQDLAGNVLASNYSWSFTTEAEPDQAAPVVVNTLPANAAASVSLGTPIYAEFNESLLASSVQAGSVELLNPSAQPLPVSLSYDAANRRVVLVPTSSLLPATTYTVVCRSGSVAVRDLAGNALVSDYSWTFTTAMDQQAPTILLVNPAPGATAVSTGTSVSIQFSEDMDPASIQATSIELRDALSNKVNASVTYNSSTRTASLQPLSALQEATVYTLIVKNGVQGVKDLAGNSLASQYVAYFTTVSTAISIFSPSLLPASFNNDGRALVLGLKFRSSEAGQIVGVRFYKAPGDNGIHIGNLWSAGGTKLAEVQFTNETASGWQQALFSTPVQIAANTVYVVSYHSSSGAYSITNRGMNTAYTNGPLRGLAAGESGANGVYRYSNVPQFPGSNFQSSNYFVDVLFGSAAAPDQSPPQITSVSPAANATAVPLNTEVRVQFNEAMNFASISTSTIELRDVANSLLSATVQYDPEARTAILQPLSSLIPGSGYRIVVKAGANGVKDVAGNALATEYSSNFISMANPNAPFVTEVNPANNAVNIAVNSGVTIQFNKALDPASVQATNVILRNAQLVSVPCTISYEAANNRILVQPLAALDYSTAYSILLKGGEGAITDTQGNWMAGDFVSVFQTISAPDLQPPVIVTHTPQANAVSVSVQTAITVQFSEAMLAGSISNASFELRANDNSVVASTVVYDSVSNTARLTPSASLLYATSYTVLVKGGELGVKDRAGNSMQVDSSWIFSTQATAQLFSVFPGTATPAAAQNDGAALNLGMKFRSSEPGFISAIRYYKPANMTGTRTGNLWTATGTKIAEVQFSNESASGWQQANLSNPVAIAANTTYVVSYYSSSGDYSISNPYFTSAVVNGPLRALANGEDGGNGVYRYASSPSFPNANYQSSNYFVDIVFSATAGPDQTPPQISSLIPAPQAGAVAVTTSITVRFNEAVSAASITGSVFELRDAANNLVPGSLTVSQNEVILSPSTSLLYNTIYTARMRGGVSGAKDLAGNSLTRDTVWSFTTTDPPPPPVGDNGPGGPLLVLYSGSNPFSRYSIEVLRAEGLNYFLAKDIATLTEAELAAYDVVLLGEVPVSSTQAGWLSNWVNAGGTLVAFRPSTQLASLLGITRQAGSLSDQYLLVNTTSGPGQGIVNQTIQFHGTADYYSLSGASSLATLYSSASTPTVYPAVTLREVGVNGGKAVAFTYDLMRSIVYTRQGNPAWAGQKRDGTPGPIRSDDLFFGGSSPDWVNLNKVAIPQADEQQRLLVNIILQGNLHRKPMPRFWFLPKGHKAAIVMTGDDHGNDGTTGRFNQYLSLGPNTAQDIADWNSVRATSYIYTGTPISNAEVQAFQNQGFEISLHLNTGCENFTATSLNNDFTTQLAQLSAQLPALTPTVTHRTHCLVWSDWATAARQQALKGIRLDVNYYYWPGAWVQNRSGMFTGSGMPMRFADLDGSLIDIYQATTQMTDESGISLPGFCDQLLDRALGAEGYYGVFVANMHTDTANHIGSNRIISSAQARNVPVISAKQLLQWLDGRNNSSVAGMNWNGNQLSFSTSALEAARNMKGMLPTRSINGTLQSITRNGSVIPYTTSLIKGIEYAFFDIPTGNASFVADYSALAGRGIPGITNVAVSNVSMDSLPATLESRLQVQAWPNPGTHHFELRFAGQMNQSLLVRISDITGRPIENYRLANPAMPLRVGSNWKTGTYFVEVIQGNDRKTIKLIKL